MFGSMISDMMIKPGSSPVFGSPRDFGLDYEDVAFTSEDGAELKGWLIFGGSDKIVVQSHFGVQSSRSGYTPKGKGMVKMWPEDIPFLRHAKYLVDQGYSVLMYDTRNHGESSAGPLDWVSWGYVERFDVLAAVRFVANHTDFRNANIHLLSICMGGASTTYAYGMDNGLAVYDRLRSMILIQPMLYPDMVKGLGIPGFLARSASRVNKKRLGIDIDTVTFLPDAPKITIPTLLIQNRNDPWGNPDTVNGFYDRLSVEKDLLWIDAEKSRAAAYNFFGAEPNKVFYWFDRYN